MFRVEISCSFMVGIKYFFFFKHITIFYKNFILCLSYLAQGGSVKNMALLFRIGTSTLNQLIPEVCQAIIDVLKPLHIPDLNTENWIKISQGFEKRWNIVNTLGAIDGRHFSLKKPPGAGSIFYNYKKFHSMVLLALCDAQKRFIWYNVGHYGMRLIINA